MLSKIRVGVFDPEPLLRDGIVHALSADPGIEVLGEGRSVVDATRFVTEHKPHVLLVAFDLSGGGLSALSAVRNTGVRIAVLTQSEREDDVMGAFNLGVCGYVLKRDANSGLSGIIRAIATGETYISSSLAGRVLLAMQRMTSRAHESNSRGLSAREEQILALAARGLTNKEVGRELQLSEKTVKNYMTSLLPKLHAKNRIEAVLAARRCGLVRQ
jgi:DNA-binding NarL/FixJ family response regulator